ncbi:MAG: IS66 family transposase [Candidatus Thiodiazotropha sp. (ex Lucinoma kastoroae)]|nr:IS66 family transposase [Candidatus Thiodiazotropha sp. (ex Lucinoma kastoroae)]
MLATAFTYIYNQWPKLIVFVEDARLNLDNNKAERHVRPIATGRKVWLFAQSEAGAKRPLRSGTRWLKQRRLTDPCHTGGFWFLCWASVALFLAYIYIKQGDEDL